MLNRNLKFEQYINKKICKSIILKTLD